MTVQPTDSQLPQKEKIEQPKVEKEAQTQQVASASAAPVEENKDERNWKRFREEREKERKALEDEKRRREESEKQAAALKAALEAIANKPASQIIQSDVEETEEEKIQRAVNKAILEAERRRIEEQQKREQQELPYKLNQTFQNFNEVCSDENLDYLQYHYPEVYNTFKTAPDSFEKWGNVYKAIKRFVPNTDSRREEKKIEQNMKKPQSMSIPGITPTTDSIPYKIDEKRRADNWARMQRTLKGGKV
jgi:hypothetical protein